MDAFGMGNADLKLKGQDKGHASELDAFHAAVAGGERFPIPWEELVETWKVSWQADEVCRSGGREE